jgi:hypothetical protein
VGFIGGDILRDRAITIDDPSRRLRCAEVAGSGPPGSRDVTRDPERAGTPGLESGDFLSNSLLSIR